MGVCEEVCVGMCAGVCLCVSVCLLPVNLACSSFVACKNIFASCQFHTPVAVLPALSCVSIHVLIHIHIHLPVLEWILHSYFDANHSRHVQLIELKSRRVAGHRFNVIVIVA